MIKKLCKKIRNRWRLHQFRKWHPQVAERRELLREVIKQGRKA